MTKRTVVPAVSALALIAGLGMAGSAQAGWNGFYLGANVGYGWGEAKQPYGAVGGPFVFTEADADQDGWVGGAHFGNQWMLGRFWVTGFEVEWDYSAVSGDDGGNGGDNNEVSGNWQAAALARLGVLITPRTQLYGIGGYGWYNADLNVTDAGEQESRQQTFTGWTWGFGFDRECANGAMTWGVRYRTTSYDQERVSFPVNGYDLGTEPKISEVSFRLSWRL